MDKKRKGYFVGCVAHSKAWELLFRYFRQHEKSILRQLDGGRRRQVSHLAGVTWNYPRREKPTLCDAAFLSKSFDHLLLSFSRRAVVEDLWSRSPEWLDGNPAFFVVRIVWNALPAHIRRRTNYQQIAALTGSNTTGPPCSVTVELYLYWRRHEVIA